jgi:DNA repair photolyase
VYCYAPAVTRRDRTAFTRAEPRPHFLTNLAKEAAARKPTEPVLLCFTCDPYCQLDVELAQTRQAIKLLHANGHAVNVLTKGGTRALRDLDLFSAADAFGTTLTFLEDGQEWQAWEPGAESPSQRLKALSEYYRAGIPTWVSLEPVLSPAAALDIIRETHPFVDLYKVGRWNYDARANAIDWAQFGRDVVMLLETLGKRYYIKHDLAIHL